MTDPDAAPQGLRDKITRQGEDALGKLAQELLENPLISGALSRAFEAREKASAAQEAAMGALNLPSAADLERLTRRVRSVSQRLEGIEDGLDRLDERVAGFQPGAGASGLEERLDAIEKKLSAVDKKIGTLDKRVAAAPGDKRLKAIEAGVEAVRAELATLRKSLPSTPEPLPRGQERFSVS